LIANLRRKHPERLKPSSSISDKGRIADMVSIHDRPEDIEGRKIIGHWEGYLITGKNHGSTV